MAEGSLKNAGYYTVDFDEPVDLESGERYAIVLYINTPGSTHPMAIEYNSGEAYMSTVNLDDGEGYISYDGVAYINVKEKQKYSKDNNSIFRYACTYRAGHA